MPTITELAVSRTYERWGCEDSGDEVPVIQMKDKMFMKQLLINIVCDCVSILVGNEIND